MPRRLLRDGRVVDDEWQYLAEVGGAGPAANPVPAAEPLHAGDASPTGGSVALILTLDQWLTDRDNWLKRAVRLGVVLAPAHKVEQIVPDLARFELIGAEFSGPSEGRGYTQGRLLRERYRFGGELRATGFVRRDQLFFLARCGFNSFELPESEIDSDSSAFTTFSAEYQPSNDAGLARKLQRR
jgi:uncharacterized protein (DUF934 family)